MSIIKLAAISYKWFVAPGFAASAMRPNLQGNPFKYITKKVNSRIPLFGRRAKQEIALSSFAQSIHQIRDKGRVPDATKLTAAYADSMLGYPTSNHLQKIQDFRNKSKYHKKFFDRASKAFIDDKGQINRTNVEGALRIGSSINRKADTVAKSKLPYVSAVGGGVIQGTREAKNPDNQGHQVKSAVKGFAKGSVLGYAGGKSITGLANVVKKKTDVFKQMSDTYFADNYWAERIDKANKSRIGKGLGKLLTSEPEKREKRIRFWNKVENIMDKKIF